MKEKYLRPVVFDSGNLDGESLVPALLGAAKAVGFLLGAFLAGKSVAKAMARPSFKLPSLTKGRHSENDISMA